MLINSNQLDLKGLKKKLSTDKVITFIFGITANGEFGPSIKFPVSGYLKEATAYCSIPGSEDVIIDIRKVSYEGRANKSPWESIFIDDKLNILTGEDSSNTVRFQMNELNKVNENDFFKVFFDQTNKDMKELTVQLTIAI